MAETTRTTEELLARLVGYDTTSHKSNLELIGFVEDYLGRHGVPSMRIPNEDGEKSNLLATIGPTDRPGVVLSGHTDVVPVTGQRWTSEPFLLTERSVEGSRRFYGRGAADMKGFEAAVLAMVPEFLEAGLATPIHIALSYDEEIGCRGVGRMIARLGKDIPLPLLAIVGEPTSMRIVTAHKGIRNFATRFIGVAAHSSAPQLGVSAIAYAAELVRFLMDLAAERRAAPVPGSPFVPPYMTFNVGEIRGGEAVNIIAEHCEVTWEFRPLPEDDPEAVVARVEDFIANDLRPRMNAQHADADIVLEPHSAVPPLRNEPDSPAARLARYLTGANSTETAAYVAEASQFQGHGVPTVLCGPGDIAQAHQPDEWIAASELEACTAFLRKLAAWAARGESVP